MSEKKPFDRSQFKGAKVSANVQASEEAQEKAKTQFPGRVGYLSLSDGKNIIRIAPPHDPNDPSVEAVMKAWLPREIKDDAGKITVKNMPIFNSNQHSPIGRDLVDEYAAFLISQTYKDMSKDEAKKHLCHLNGYRTPTGFVSGIRHSVGYVAYVWKGEEFGAVEFTKVINDRMNELSVDEESDETIAMDPFSDPDTGVNLIITIDHETDSAGKKKKVYKVSKGSKPVPLTDDQLIKLSEATSLAGRFRNSYTQEDFNNSLESLKYFDELHGYGVFEQQEFIDIVEEIHDLVMNCPEIRINNKTDDGEENSSVAKPALKKSPAKPVAKSASSKTISKTIQDDDGTVKSNKEELFGKDEPEEGEDGLDDLDPQELKDYAEEAELGLVFKTAYPKSKIIAMIREKVAALKSGSDLPFVVEEEPKKTEKSATPGSSRAKLDELRKKK